MKMDVEQRKALVRELLDSYGSKCNAAADILKSAKSTAPDFVYENLRAYVLSKLLLAPDTEGDDIEDLISRSIERIESIDTSILDELQNKRPCNYMTAVSTKKVMLYYALRNDLEADMKAADMVSQTTLRGLANVVASALNANGII